MGGGDDFLGRMSRSAPGTTMEYGRGANPPRDLVQAMRPYVAAGVLHPTTKRVAGEVHFLVQRGAGDFGDVLKRSAAARGRVRQPRIRKTSLSMVLDCLLRAARRKEPCPTNEELAAACGLSGKLAASYRVRCLVASGKIAVEDHSPWGRRVVTILTGTFAGLSTREASL